MSGSPDVIVLGILIIVCEIGILGVLGKIAKHQIVENLFADASVFLIISIIIGSIVSLPFYVSYHPNYLLGIKPASNEPTFFTLLLRTSLALYMFILAIVIVEQYKILKGD